MGLRKKTYKDNEPLTEQTIQMRLNRFLASWKYNVDGLYVFGWESDKLIWTRSGYIYEFEIKISRADYKNDFKNKKEKHIILKGPTEQEKYMPHFYQSYEWNKQNYKSFEEYVSKSGPESNDLIANRRKPNYFYYTVPEGLIRPEEVPEYAGLLWIRMEDGHDGGIIIKKKAPMLHKTKYKDAELNLAEKFWYNWQADRELRRQAQKERDDARKALETELAVRHQEETYESLKQKYSVVSKECNDYKDAYYQASRDQGINRMIIRKLRQMLKQLQPKFDYEKLERQCELCYGIK